MSASTHRQEKKLKTLQLQQGSQEWLAVRAKHFTASEASAMLGLSKYMSRQELLRQKATGYVPEVDAAKQRLFDRGHEAEAAARPIVEVMIGEDLFPTTGTRDVEGLPLLASFDGITMDGSKCWENKLHNQELEMDIQAGSIADHYWPQLEQQLLVSGAEEVYFTTSDGTYDNTIGMWYRSIPKRRQQLIAGWKQFAEDLANYQHVEVAAPVSAASIQDLPALNVQIVGSVVASNLTEWQAVVTDRIESINEDLQDDQDFADADAMTKFLADGEKSLELVKANAQAQAQPIDALFRSIDAIKETMRQKRLNLEKKVKARKESIRGEIVQEGKDALAKHVAELNKQIGRPLMQPINADFASAIKGKKTVTSVRDAMDTELAAAKIKANDMASVIADNLATLDELGKDYPALFADLAHIVTKAPEDFAALVKVRISDHKEAEEKRLEAEREKIRQEEAQKLAEQATAAQKPPVAQPNPAEALADTPAVTRAIVAAPVRNIEAAAPGPRGRELELIDIVDKLTDQMTEAELQLVIHYCERLIEQREEAA